jgi:hypothetical protein
MQLASSTSANTVSVPAVEALGTIGPLLTRAQHMYRYEAYLHRKHVLLISSTGLQLRHARMLPVFNVRVSTTAHGGTRIVSLEAHREAPQV